MFRTRSALLASWLALASLAGVPGALAQQGIAAVVNDRAVSLRDLDQRLDLIIASGNLPSDDQIRQRLGPQVVRGLIDEQLQLQEASRIGVGVSDQEVENGIDLIAERNEVPRETLLAFLDQRGVPVETLRDQIRAQIAWAKTVSRALSARVVVTDDQVDLAVEAIERGQGRPEYRLREIILPVYDPGAEREVEADAERLVSTLRQGADFASVAAQVSASATAEQGGSIGWVRETELAPDLLPVVQALQPGEVSAPQRSAGGYTILFLEARRIAGQSAQDLEGVEVRLAQILFPASADASPEEVADLQAEAAALAPELDSCADVAAVAERIGAPSSGELGWFPAADLPPVLAQTVVNQEIGEISDPVRGPSGLHLLMVCERRGGEPPSETSVNRDQVREQLEREQLENLARRYLRDLRRQAYVDVRL